jgi:hypothetical protein
LNDGRIQNPSKPFGIVPLSNFVPRRFGFVHHSITTILYHDVPHLSLTIRHFCIAVAGQKAQPLIRVDHAAPHTYHVATPSTDAAGVQLLLSVATRMSAAVHRYAEAGPRGLPPSQVFVQWGVGTGRCEAFHRHPTVADAQHARGR